MDKKQAKWKLFYGVHKGTLGSRDTHVVECDSLQACRDEIESIERNLRTVGYVIWFASALPPGGIDADQIRIHAGNSCY